MSRVLITRFSSFGDVAILVPVVSSVAIAYPQVQFTVMTKKAYAPLFEHMNFNVSVIGIDLDKTNGFFSLCKIIRKACGFKYTHLADEHNVLRTRIMRLFMPFFYTKRATIDKGKKEKRLMIESKITSPPLEPTVERYLDVFLKLGFTKTKLNFSNIFAFQSANYGYIKDIVPEKQGKWIGIAPFSKHEGKTLPFSKIKEVIEILSTRENVTIFIFGIGENKREIQTIENKYSNVIILHRMRLKKELILISHLDVMLSMDSANMHLASLCEVPVVSTWGATHPSLGFYGYKQSLENAIQVNLPCRPCSVYGENPCKYHGDEEYMCLKKINVNDIILHIDNILYKG